jgi:hypothetical protein
VGCDLCGARPARARPRREVVVNGKRQDRGHPRALCGPGRWP